MRIDLVISTVDIDARTAIEATQLAEQSGFDAVWTYDHVSGVVLRGTSVLDVWTVLGAMAQATEQITIGSLVVNATTRQVAHISTAAATLQQLSSGRFVLGLGAGAGPESSFARELFMFGLAAEDAPTRRQRVAETVESLRALWSGSASYSGEQVHFNGVEGVALPHPPPRIIVGANGPRMAELAGRFADGVNLHSWERDLGAMVAVARGSAAEAGRAGFEVSVESPFAVELLDAGSVAHADLAALGVDRVQLRWTAADGFAPIVDAATYFS